MMLPKYQLVTFTWGNASEIDSATGLVAIKPSGVPYDELSPEKMVLIDLQGNVIVEEFRRFQKDVLSVPAVLCKNHGPFTWGKCSAEAVHNSVVLEECAKMAYRTELINSGVKEAPQELIEKHYMRKHGANAYYGQ